MVNGVKKVLKKAKDILLAEPELIFQGERQLVNMPFYFPGTNGKAVLLIHGWTTTPYELRRLGRYLNEKGYTVSAPLLRGHGTNYKDLENIKWTDWIVDAAKAYDKLKKNHKKIYVAGTSLGANLSILLGKNKPEIAGLILMAMPYKIRAEKIVIFLAEILSFFKKYSRKFYPPTFGAKTTITRAISYQTYPIKSALEAFKLIRVARNELAKISQPSFIMQSTSDHVATKNSLEKIFEKINSKIKKKKYIKRAYHTFISDIKNEHVFEDILNFLNEN